MTDEVEGEGGKSRSGSSKGGVVLLEDGARGFNDTVFRGFRSRSSTDSEVTGDTYTGWSPVRQENL